MIYGRRFQNANRRARKKGTQIGSDYRQLQRRYGLYFLIGISFSLLIFVVPNLYFTLENYSIFKKLAYDTNPELLTYLERELVWLGFFATFSAITVVVLATVLSRRLITHLLRPLNHMEAHMKSVSEGDWSSRDLSPPSQADFLDLLVTYASMYRNIRAENEFELQVLEKMIIDPHHRASHANWQALIQAKKNKLGIKPEVTVEPVVANDGDPAELTAATREQRRVS